jgi:hypothetical protein
MKIAPLINKWAVMYCGSPSTYRSLLVRMNHWLANHSFSNDITSMRKAINHAYDAELDEQLRKTVLAHLGIGRSTFRRIGLRQLGDTLFKQIEADMLAIAAARRDDPNRTELIVCGFDGFGDPNLLRVGGDGTIADNTILGFDVMGSGSELARASLQFHDEFVRATRLGEVCYRLQAAKFAAESSSFVGPVQTVTAVIRPNWRVSMNFGAVDSREYFEAEKAREIPESVLASIEAMESAPSKPQ